MSDPVSPELRERVRVAVNDFLDLGGDPRRGNFIEAILAEEGVHLLAFIKSAKETTRRVWYGEALPATEPACLRFLTAPGDQEFTNMIVRLRKVLHP